MERKRLHRRIVAFPSNSFLSLFAVFMLAALHCTGLYQVSTPNRERESKLKFWKNPILETYTETQLYYEKYANRYNLTLSNLKNNMNSRIAKQDSNQRSRFSKQELLNNAFNRGESINFIANEEYTRRPEYYFTNNKKLKKRIIRQINPWRNLLHKWNGQNYRNINSKDSMTFNALQNEIGANKFWQVAFRNRLPYMNNFYPKITPDIFIKSLNKKLNSGTPNKMLQSNQFKASDNRYQSGGECFIYQFLCLVLNEMKRYSFRVGDSNCKCLMDQPDFAFEIHIIPVTKSSWIPNRFDTSQRKHYTGSLSHPRGKRIWFGLTGYIDNEATILITTCLPIDKLTTCILITTTTTSTTTTTPKTTTTKKHYHTKTKPTKTFSFYCPTITCPDKDVSLTTTSSPKYEPSTSTHKTVTSTSTHEETVTSTSTHETVTSTSTLKNVTSTSTLKNVTSTSTHRNVTSTLGLKNVSSITTLKPDNSSIHEHHKSNSTGNETIDTHHKPDNSSIHDHQKGNSTKNEVKNSGEYIHNGRRHYHYDDIEHSKIPPLRINDVIPFRKIYRYNKPVAKIKAVANYSNSNDKVGDNSVEAIAKAVAKNITYVDKVIRNSIDVKVKAEDKRVTATAKVIAKSIDGNDDAETSSVVGNFTAQASNSSSFRFRRNDFDLKHRHSRIYSRRGKLGEHSNYLWNCLYDCW